jgi:hypothetical protein
MLKTMRDFLVGAADFDTDRAKYLTQLSVKVEAKDMCRSDRILYLDLSSNLNIPLALPGILLPVPREMPSVFILPHRL